MKFERTRDYELVREIITTPGIWEYVTDDFSPSRNEFRPTEHEGIWYILAGDNQNTLIGMWALVPQNGACWEIHTYMLPGSGFSARRTAARELADFLFSTTQCRRIVTNVPEFNRAARIFAKAAGMIEFGINPKSYLKNGVLFDQHLLGISKPTDHPEVTRMSAIPAQETPRLQECA